MIKHMDWDKNESPLIQEFELPSSITSIEISHDGGRLEILINGQTVFFSSEGTRDCLVTIDSQPIERPA